MNSIPPFVIAIPILAILAGLGYYFIIRPRIGGSKVPPPSSDWEAQYSSGVRIEKVSGLYTFKFGEPHHIVRKPPSGGLLGKTIRMRFSLEGTGRLVPTDSDPPATLQLFLQHSSGDVTRARLRWWTSSTPLDRVPGDYSISAKIAPEVGWTSVSGESSQKYPSDFARAASEAGAIGFTFGGMFYAHGVNAKEGDVRFILRDYDIS